MTLAHNAPARDSGIGVQTYEVIGVQTYQILVPHRVCSFDLKAKLLIYALLIGTLLTMLTVSLHAIGTTWWIYYLRKPRIPAHRTITRVQEIRLLASTATIILLLAMLEVTLWAAAYLLIGDNSITTFEEAVYFSAVTFTSLGYGDVVMTGAWWRLISAIEAVTGLLVFGWSSAIFFAVVQEIWHSRGIGRDNSGSVPKDSR